MGVYSVNDTHVGVYETSARIANNISDYSMQDYRVYRLHVTCLVYSASALPPLADQIRVHPAYRGGTQMGICHSCDPLAELLPYTWLQRKGAPLFEFSSLFFFGYSPIVAYSRCATHVVLALVTPFLSCCTQCLREAIAFHVQ